MKRVHMKKPTAIFRADFNGKLCHVKTDHRLLQFIAAILMFLYNYKSREAVECHHLLEDTGTKHRIKISELSQKLTLPVCSALPAIQVFTAYNYTAAFH